ncbi:MAG TPA: hypothetical protein VLJ57_18160 [Burkholderiaceae bacterium]|nr:hypothetical protein [Burkholderiaceae bacterium]
MLGVFAGLLALAVFGPALAQPADHHGFADQRGWLGIPYAVDVLSNLPFALFGFAGLVCCGRLPAAVDPVQRALAVLFFGGLMVTAGASAWYHWQPVDAGLAVDRCGMAVAFAGLLGLVVAGRVSARAGAAVAAATLLLGPLSVWAWAESGNVLPWAVVQFGGMGLVLWMAACKPLAGAWPVRWAAVVLIYAAAKGLEQADHWIFALDQGWISGHSLKHVVASLAAWPVLVALRCAMRGAVGAPLDSRQNPAGTGGAALAVPRLQPQRLTIGARHGS